MKSRILLTLLLLLVSDIILIAQVNLSLSLPNPMPGQLSMWENDRTLIQAIIDNRTGTTYQQVQFSFVVMNLTTGIEAARSNDNNANIPRFTIPPGMTTLYGIDLVNADAVTINEALRITAVTTNSLPEGEYEICARLLADDGSTLTTPDVCQIFSVIIPDPPTLITPNNNAVLESSTLPIFSWTPVIISPGTQARYRLIIAPMYAGQSPRDAIDRNDPLLNQIVLMNSYAYQASDPLFSIIESAVSFAWQIQALDNFDQPATRNEGKSEIYTFSFLPNQQEFTIEVSPQQIDISPSNESREITFTFSLPQSAEEQIVLTSYEAAWTDEDRFYRETSGEIVLDSPIAIFPGEVVHWSKTDTYDEQLREILLANREQAAYLKTFTFFSSGERAIPSRTFIAPSYHVYLTSSSFAVTANPPVLEFNPAVTNREINFEFQGSSTADVHVTQMTWSARYADGSTAEQGTIELNLNVPRGGTSNWSFTQNASRETQCGILNHLQVDETDVTLTYQFDGELEVEASTYVTAMTGTIIHISGGSFTVSANPAVLQFNPEQTQQEISFQFEAGCNNVRVTRYAATGTTADNHSIDIEPSAIDMTIIAGSTGSWSLPQFLDSEGQLLLLNRLGLDETDIRVIYQFDGELQLDGGGTQSTSAMASFLMHVSRTGIAPASILISSPDPFPLHYNPEISYHPISFYFRLYEESAALITRNTATWYFPDGTTEVIEDDMVDIPVPSGEIGTWETGLRIESNIQQNRLDHFGVNRLPVRIMYMFEIHNDRGNVYNVRALTADGDDLDFIVYRDTQDTTISELIVWAIPSEVSFFPGSTSHEITYNLDLYPSAQAADTLKTAAVTYRDENGVLYRGPIVSTLTNPIILNIGDETTTTAALTVDDADRESMLPEGTNTRTLTATTEFSGMNSSGQIIFAASNPITMHIFRTAEAAGLSNYVLMNGVAYIRTTNQTIVTTEGEKKILNGSATLVILPSPFDSTEVAVDLVNLTFAPGSGLHVTSGSLMAESPPDSRLFSLLGSIFNVTRLSYDHSRDSTQRFLINQAYVIFLNDRIDLTDVIVNRDGVSFEHASIEKSLFNFLTLRLTDMRSGKENNKKILSFTVHARLKGKPRNDEFGFTSLKIIAGGGLELHVTPEPAPLRIIPGTDYLRFKDFEVQRDSDNWFIKVTADLTYPPPFNSLGPIETFFKVDQDGNIVGEVAPIKEMTPGFAGDRTLVTLGKFAVIDLTYLGLQLSLVDGEIDNEHSRVGLACDFYFELVGQDSLRVSVGSPNDPGITIDFDGNIHWQAITIAHDKKLKFGPLYLKLSNFVVNPDPDTAKNYYFELSGGLGVDFPKVDGEVNFEAIRVTKEGNFDMSSTIVRGGEFSIVDVVHLGLDSMSFSNEPGTITFDERIGDHKETRSIDTDSYLRLKGASLSIGSAGDGGAGGFDDLLVYTSNNQTSFLLRKAKITIASVEVKIDCKYLTDDPQLGTILSVAGSVKTPKFEGAVIGKMGQRADGKDTYGLFLAVSDLGLQLGPITLDALGGGFFYNPIEDDLEIVRSNCGIDRPEIRESISEHRPEGADDPGSFAAMIYAGAFVGSKDAVEGRALITITENSLTLDMQVEVLKKAGKGAAYLVFGWDPTYAEGRTSFNLDYHSILTADVEVDFYAYTSDIWGLNGTTEVKLLVFAEADANFFVGPPGFMLDTRLEVGFDVGVLKAEAGFETMVWWQKNVSWGAYVNVWAEGELLWGLVGVAGRLEGALIGDPGLLIYAVGTFRAEVCWVEVFDGSIWITVGADGFDGGTGRNSKYDSLIEDAKNMADRMEEEMNDLASAIDEAQNAIQTMSDEQVARAGQELMTNLTQNPLTTALYYTSYKTDHDDYEGTNTQTTIIRDILFGRTPRNNRWWLDTLINGKNELAAKEQEIQSTIDALTTKKDRMRQKLDAYHNLLTGQLPSIQDLQCRNPIGEATFATVVINGIEHLVKNGFAFDTLQANQNRANIERTKEETEAYEDRLFEMVNSFKNNIDSIDNILYSGTEPVLNIGRDYTNAFEDINDYYEKTFEYFVEIQNIAATRRAALWEPDIRSAIEQQTNALAPNEQSLRGLQNLVTLRSGVIQSLDSTYNQQLNAETLETWKALCDTLGILMWYKIPHAGFTYLVENSVASRNTVREVFERTRDGFVTQWKDYTQTLEGIYTRTSRLYELLYDLYDNLTLTATRLPITKIEARQLGNPTPSKYYTTERNKIADYLEIPRISSFTGTSRSTTDHTAKLSLSFSATHPKGIVEYGYHVKYPAPPLQQGQQPLIVITIGSPKFRSVGNDTRTHLLLVQTYGTGDPDRPGDYEISLRARTRSGYTITRKGTVNIEYSTGSIITNSISTTDNTPPTTPVVTDEGQYTSATGVLFAKWQAADNQSGIQEYQYSVETQTTTTFGGHMVGGVLVGGRTISSPLRIRDWTSVGGITQLNIRDLSLEHGKTYWVKVRAKNGVDLWSEEGKSDGIVVDTSLPTAPEITEFRQALTHNALRLHWTPANDPQSDIDHYEVSLGTHPFGTDIENSILLPGDAILRTLTNIPLFDGSIYHVTLKAFNGSGLTNLDTASVTIHFTDETTPDHPTISEAYYRTKDSTLIARWSASDLQSGISEFQYSLGEMKRGAVAYSSWVSAAMNRSLELKRETMPVQIRIKATNGVRLSSQTTKAIEKR